MEKENNYREIINNKRKEDLFERIILFISGVFLYSFSFSVFFNRNDLVSGGVSGLSILVNNIYKIDTSLFVFIISSIILIIGYMLLDKEQIIRTLPGIILLPVFLKITSYFPLVLQVKMPSKFLVSLFAGIIMGFGNGIIIKSGYSCGGVQTIYQILYKKLRISIGKSTLLCNSVIILGCLKVFDLSSALYSLIAIYIASVITDKILLETSMSKTFYIVTDKEKEVLEYITENIHHTVTIINGKEGETNKNKKILMCDIPYREYYMTKEVIKEIDKDSFFLILDTYEITGGM